MKPDHEIDPEWGVLTYRSRCAHLRRVAAERTLCGLRFVAWMPRKGEDGCSRCEAIAQEDDRRQRKT